MKLKDLDVLDKFWAGGTCFQVVAEAWTAFGYPIINVTNSEGCEYAFDPEAEVFNVIKHKEKTMTMTKRTARKVNTLEVGDVFYRTDWDDVPRTVKFIGSSIYVEFEGEIGAGIYDLDRHVYVETLRRTVGDYEVGEILRLDGVKHEVLSVGEVRAFVRSVEMGFETTYSLEAKVDQ